MAPYGRIILCHPKLLNQDVAEGDIITTPLGTGTLLAIEVTPEQERAPMIQATPSEINTYNEK